MKFYLTGLEALHLYAHFLSVTVTLLWEESKWLKLENLEIENKQFKLF